MLGRHMVQFYRTCGRLMSGFLLLSLVACSKNKIEDPGFTVNARTFGGIENDNSKAVIRTSDNGYAVLGHTQSQDGDITDKQNTSFDYWLLKFDAQSTLQWTKTFGGSDDDRGNSLLQTSDGGFAILGYSQSSDGDVVENAGAQDHWIARTDTSGNLIWQKSYGFSGRDEGISVIQTNDLGFLIVGVLDVTASGGEGSTSRRKHAGGDYWAIKITANGELQWSNFFGGTFTDTAYDVVETQEGSFIIVGSSDSTDVDISDNKGAYDFWVVKISGSGDLVWEKNYGGSEIDEAHAIISSSDGNYLIVGETRSNDGDIAFNNGAADVWVIKISDNSDLIWEKTYGGSSFDVGRAITKLQNGGYIIAGSSRSADGDVSANQGQNDVWLLKIDDNGSLKWEQTIGGSQIDFAHAITELVDGTIIAVGETASSDMDIPQNKGFTDVLTIEIK